MAVLNVSDASNLSFPVLFVNEMWHRWRSWHSSSTVTLFHTSNQLKVNTFGWYFTLLFIISTKNIV